MEIREAEMMIFKIFLVEMIHVLFFEFACEESTHFDFFEKKLN